MKYLSGILCLPLLFQGMGGESGEEEIKYLFRSIEKNLQEIDKLLLDARSENAGAEMEAVQKKIDELLKKALESQQQCVKQMEEILKKAPSSGNSSGNSLPQPEPNPKDQKPSSKQEREKLPQDPGQTNPKNPANPQDAQQSGDNVKAPPPRLPQPDPTNQSNQGGKWGELPPMYQELFRNQKTDQMPLRYQRWIDDYYRRIHQTKP